jgi:hypothetical protein
MNILMPVSCLSASPVIMDFDVVLTHFGKFNTNYRKLKETTLEAISQKRIIHHVIRF